MSFSEGAIITNVEKEGRWWKGDLGWQKQKLFPANKIDATSAQPEVDNPTLPELNSKEGYTCAAQSALCLVYLPNGCTENISVGTGDLEVHSKLQSNEITLTSVVRILPHGVTFSSSKPAIIELMKTIEPTNQNPNLKLVPLFSYSDSQEWKEIASHGCEMLKDRLVFKTTHFSYFVVIGRFPLPSARVTIEPGMNQPAEVKIPELPGFKVEIPPTSIRSTTEITATIHYDDSKLYNGHISNHSLATTCVALEPHNTHFVERIPITIPIPSYSKITKEYPGIRLELWHANGTSEEDAHIKWELKEDSNITIHCDGEGNGLATAFVTHFSWLTYLWNTLVHYPLNFFVRSVRGRCQVFMSQETKRGPFITFGIAVLLYPFQDPYPTLQNYTYDLYDSKVPVELTEHEVECQIVLDDSLLLYRQNCHSQQCYERHCRFSKDFYARADFSMKVDAGSESELPAGILAELFIKQGSDVESYNFTLIKVTVLICELVNTML